MSDDATTLDFYKQLLAVARPVDFTSIYRNAEAGKVDTQVNILERFSAAETIDAIAREINSITENNPDKRFVVMMRTPDGRMMVVERVRPTGFSAFVAEGWIDDLKCMTSGHISTLSVFIAIDEKQSKKTVGYTAKATTVFQPKPELSKPDKKQSNQ